MDGRLEVLKWLHNTGCTCFAAAAGGNLEVLNWLHSTGCPWGSAMCAGGAMGGHLAPPHWAREHRCPWDKDTVRAHAAHGGHVDMLRCLDEQGAP